MQAQQIFLERLPRRPYCSDNLDHGLAIRPVETALRYRQIQPNAPHSVTWLVFDLDYPMAAIAWEKANLPSPTICMVNPNNGHAHLAYGLHTPIVTSEAGRDAPIRYAAAVQVALRVALEADHGYAGLIAKNPLHPSWRVAWVNKLYDLGELAEYVTLPKRLPAREQYGLGRNCTLFDELRGWAYQWVRIYKRNSASVSEWQQSVLGQAQRLNVFDTQLPSPEVRAIAKSVSRWVWQRFNDQTFSTIQSARGRLGGRPRTTTKEDRPWEAMFISRATYYRRLQSGILLPTAVSDDDDQTVR